MQKKISKKEEPVKIIIPKIVYQKIEHLCNVIPDVEWSGILVYKIKSGTIKKPSKLKIEIKDIIPMNKGTKGYTEYDFNTKKNIYVEAKRDTSQYEDRMIDYFMEYPQALKEDWKIGHIHSHNTMAVFFSGTDTDELHTNSKSHNFYLSLIVNNKMEMIAKIGQNLKAITTVKTYYTTLDEKGNEYRKESVELQVKKEKVIEYDCEVIKPSISKSLFDNTFLNNINSIIKESKRFSYSNNNFNNFQNKNTSKKNIQFINSLSPLPTQNIMSEEEENLDEFLHDLLNSKITDPLTEMYMDLEDMLDYIDSFRDQINFTTYVTEILDNYGEFFNYHYPMMDEKGFLKILTNSINRLNEFVKDNPWLNSIVNGLKSYKEKYMKYGLE